MNRRIHFLISLSLMLPILASASDGKGVSNQIISCKPAISIGEALQIGERFIKDNQINVSNQYIHSIQLYYSDKGEKRGHYWHIQYLWSTPRLGMEHALKIFMDGTVFQEVSGP